MHDPLCPRAHRSWVPRFCRCSVIEKARANGEAMKVLSIALDRLAQQASRKGLRNPMEHDPLCPRDKDTIVRPELCTFCQLIEQVRSEYE